MKISKDQLYELIKNIIKEELLNENYDKLDYENFRKKIIKHVLFLKGRGAKQDRLYFSNENLRSIDLSDISNLDGTSYIACNIRGGNFYGNSLKNASFSDSEGQYIDFSHCDLFRTIFSNVNFSNIRFFYANLNQALLNNAVIQNSDFRNSKIIKCNCQNADFSGSSFENAQLDNSILDANLNGCTFSQDALQIVQKHPDWESLKNSIKVTAQNKVYLI